MKTALRLFSWRNRQQPYGLDVLNVARLRPVLIR